MTRQSDPREYSLFDRTQCRRIRSHPPGPMQSNLNQKLLCGCKLRNLARLDPPLANEPRARQMVLLLRAYRGQPGATLAASRGPHHSRSRRLASAPAWRRQCTSSRTPRRELGDMRCRGEQLGETPRGRCTSPMSGKRCREKLDNAGPSLTRLPCFPAVDKPFWRPADDLRIDTRFARRVLTM